MRAGVIIKTNDGHWSVTRFLDETSLNNFIRMVSVQLNDIIKTIDIVQLDPTNPIYPPDGYETTFEDYQNRKYWCPWCGEVRYFAQSEDFPDDHFCTTCHISDHDYHIKRINKLELYEGSLGSGERRKKREPRKKRKEQRVKRIKISEE